MAFLFLVAIGPVQAFIASARRTRDLWFGSTLLSELSKTAAWVITNPDTFPPGELIFPAPHNNELLEANSELLVANKILAIIEGDPVLVGQRIQSAIEERLNAMKNRMYDQVDRKNIYIDAADAQIKDLVEFSWVALPYNRTEQQYGEKRAQLEAMMAARKNIRLYQQVTWGAAKYKSSIDGKMESVLKEPTSPDKKKRAEEKYRLFHAGPAEHLSGIDLLKRRGTFRASSPGQDAELTVISTSHVASLSYLQRLSRLSSADQKQARGWWQDYITTIKNIVTAPLDRIPQSLAAHGVIDRYDGALLFPERLLQDMVDQKGLKEIEAALHTFFEQVGKLCGAQVRPYPYYAIIRADGDGMGKVIDRLAKEPDGEEQHRKLSRALDSFANGVKGIIERYQGALVYSGGDDVLAFVPLHTMLACTRELASSFRKNLANFTNEQGESPTLSAGIVIVHHLEMLQQALSLSQDAEQRAKGFLGKNALAIVLSKRSGEQYSVVGRWDDLDRYLDLLTAYYRADFLPKGAAYELRESVLRLTPLPASNISTTDREAQARTARQIMALEARRILKRKLELPQSKVAQNIGSTGQAEGKMQKHREKAQEILTYLLARIEGTQDEHGGASITVRFPPRPGEQEAPLIQAVPIDEFIHELIIAPELADALELAGSEQEGVS